MNQVTSVLHTQGPLHTLACGLSFCKGRVNNSEKNISWGEDR